MSIPAFVNVRSGSTQEAAEVVRRAHGILARDVAPEELAEALRAEVRRGAPRVLVVGGDGTVSVASAALARSATELAVIPAGTLNHFARDYEIPMNVREALELARSGSARSIDLGAVNGQYFVNTSSVGAYVTFVRARERLEPYLGYRLSSLIAAIQVLTHVRRHRVLIETSDRSQAYETPLVFVGVGERALGLRGAGARVHAGDSVLHVVVPRPGTTALGLARRFAAAGRGARSASSSMLAEAMLSDHCTIELRRELVRVSLDGELVLMRAPLRYELHPGALRVVLPPVAGALDRPA
jgi:diacylglycerol kinase family enzyme